MGAETVMLEAGARNVIGVTSPPAGLDRSEAYVALSPEGPGMVYRDHTWERIHKPMFILIGTRDQALIGGPETRQIPWRDLLGTPATLPMARGNRQRHSHGLRHVRLCSEPL